MFLYRNDPSTLALSKRLYTAVEVVLVGLVLVLAGHGFPRLIQGTGEWAVALLVYGLIGVLIVRFWPHGALGWANRVTLVRSALIALIAGGLIANVSVVGQWQWLGIAAAALLLDGVDGFVARSTHCESDFGARFDMELDALLILLLCLALITTAELAPWVLLIGAMRYGFVLASNIYPWLKAPLFPSWRRKAVCVWQVAALLLALTPLTPSDVSALFALSALITLVYSFGVDMWWLYRRHPV
ncbi:CDP-alcohol phosphatidyltransferase family protein [Halomonas sp. ATCHA]|uniref:CDP-alcohol phosphatidyltransferase family protein n=2 Tax=Halomonas llamarensis TaxID=2945104 RepID=A0ABT0SPV3_9GAMM|nr:CDP-alcohol phosphatidyltransferase family protein [Halomonas llamarensis]MCL7929843.1 CDP-alcohol phosphatidyltransferase family protein [Halomonas llamarensis]